MSLAIFLFLISCGSQPEHSNRNQIKTGKRAKLKELSKICQDKDLENFQSYMERYLKNNSFTEFLEKLSSIEATNGKGWSPLNYSFTTLVKADSINQASTLKFLSFSQNILFIVLSSGQISCLFERSSNMVDNGFNETLLEPFNRLFFSLAKSFKFCNRNNVICDSFFIKFKIEKILFYLRKFKQEQERQWTWGVYIDKYFQKYTNLQERRDITFLYNLEIWTNFCDQVIAWEDAWDKSQDENKKFFKIKSLFVSNSSYEKKTISFLKNIIEKYCESTLKEAKEYSQLNFKALPLIIDESNFGLLNLEDKIYDNKFYEAKKYLEFLQTSIDEKNPPSNDSYVWNDKIEVESKENEALYELLSKSISRNIKIFNSNNDKTFSGEKYIKSVNEEYKNKYASTYGEDKKNLIMAFFCFDYFKRKNAPRSPGDNLSDTEKTNILEQLLKASSIHKEVDGRGNNILHYAAYYGEKETVEYILENWYEDFVDTKNRKDGGPPLRLIDSVNTEGGDSALHLVFRGMVAKKGEGLKNIAKYHDRIEIVNIFLDKGIDLSIKNFQGKTALDTLINITFEDAADIEIVKELKNSILIAKAYETMHKLLFWES